MDTSYLEKYYEKFCEEKRLASRHGQVEFTTTMKYVHEYLKKCKYVESFRLGGPGEGGVGATVVTLK